MQRDEVLTALTAHREAIRRFGIASLALFGSVARDEAGPASDLDLLVEFIGPPTFDGYMGLKFYLEDLLGRRIDLVIREDLKPRLRARVEREAIRVA